MIDLVSLCNFGFSLSILSVQKQQNVESMDEFEKKNSSNCNESELYTVKFSYYSWNFSIMYST